MRALTLLIKTIAIPISTMTKSSIIHQVYRRNSSNRSSIKIGPNNTIQTNNNNEARLSQN